MGGKKMVFFTGSLFLPHEKTNKKNTNVVAFLV